MTRMTSQVSKFQTAFVGTDITNRGVLIEHLKKRNSKNEEVVNLLTTINTTDVCVKNNNKSDSIYFICRQLRDIPTFKY